MTGSLAQTAIKQVVPGGSLAGCVTCSEGFFGPSVLFLDLSFFFRGEIVLDVEVLSDLLDRLVLNLGGDLSAGELEEWLNIEVVGGHDELEELFLLEVDVISVPLFDDLVHVVVGEGLVNLGWLVVEHSSAEHNDLFKNWLLDLGEWDLLIGAGVFDKTLDEDGFLSDVDWDFDGLTVVAEEFDYFSHMIFGLFNFNNS